MNTHFVSEVGQGEADLHNCFRARVLFLTAAKSAQVPLIQISVFSYLIAGPSCFREKLVKRCGEAVLVEPYFFGLG